MLLLDRPLIEACLPLIVGSGRAPPWGHLLRHERSEEFDTAVLEHATWPS
jgi:hypothetical protein